ncbi:MAG: 50S ribosomal protein L3 [Candidatus Omnitrophota bacterium]|nr:50S ribosomal protein L3 [Candidatus Omnitrophota bacterium]
MSTGLLGKKIGMTQVFDGQGNLVPVTAIEAGPCFVLEIKETPHAKIKLGFGPKKESRVKKPQLGFFKKINVSPLGFVRELPLGEFKDCKVGQEIKADIFKEGEYLHITGTSIGKGFQGGVKRWHWKGGKKTHGSTSHRRVGSIGSSTTPGRTIRGHHMPGHMGAETVTVKNLRIVKVDAVNNLLLVKGAVPGFKTTYLILKKSAKKPKVAPPKAESKKEVKIETKKKK